MLRANFPRGIRHEISGNGIGSKNQGPFIGEDAEFHVLRIWACPSNYGKHVKKLQDDARGDTWYDARGDARHDTRGNTQHHTIAGIVYSFTILYLSLWCNKQNWLEVYRYRCALGLFVNWK